MRWRQKSCKKGEESFHGLKRESATMEVGEAIRCTCQLPSDALLRVNGLKFACASNGYKRA